MFALVSASLLSLLVLPSGSRIAHVQLGLSAPSHAQSRLQSRPHLDTARSIAELRGPIGRELGVRIQNVASSISPQGGAWKGAPRAADGTLAATIARDFASSTERLLRLTRDLRLTEQVTWAPKVDIAGSGVLVGIGLTGLLE